MIVIKWVVVISALFVAYLAGFNSGTNRGYDLALVNDPMCKGANQCPILPHRR